MLGTDKEVLGDSQKGVYTRGNEGRTHQLGQGVGRTRKPEMSGEYDTVTRMLLQQCGLDWLTALAPQLHITPPIIPETLDPALATVQRFPDHVFFLPLPQPSLLHLEIQSNWEPTLPQRLLEYNVLLRGRRRLPVRSAVLLLHRRLQPPSTCGNLAYQDSHGQVYLRFDYGVVRVWELPGEELLQGPLGAAMLGLLTEQVQGRLKEWTRRFIRRVEQEVSDRSSATALWVGAYILLGLLYDAGEIERWFAGAQGMKEPSTYRRMWSSCGPCWCPSYTSNTPKTFAGDPDCPSPGVE